MDDRVKVLVIGASGFVGSHTVRHLLADGYKVRCLVRATSSRSELPSEGVEWAVGDVTKIDTISRAAEGMNAVVNITNMLLGEAPEIAKAIRQAGVSRLVAVGTTAIYTTLASTRRQRRLSAEESLLASGLETTIVRPTMIYGTARDRNICRLIRYMRRFPVIPVIGSGRFLQQPVHVDDVASAISKSLQNPTSAGRGYDISGQDSLTYVDLIETISRLMGKRVLRLHLPSAPVIRAMQITERLKIRLPIKSEQLQRINENKAFSNADAVRDFGYQPRTFAQGVTTELAEMGFLKQ